MRVYLLTSFFFFTSFIFSQTISWQQLSGPHGGAIYSIVTDNSGNIYVNAFGTAGPYKSTDDGESWFPIANGLTPVDNGGYHPLNINSSGDLFIGGAHPTAKLCRSTDGGNLWEPLNNLNTSGGSIICISFDNYNNVYVGTGTGIYRSTDNGDNWLLYGSFTVGTDAIVFNNSNHVFAGTSGGVYRTTDDGATWSQLPTGGATGTLSIASNDYIFAGITNGGIIRSTNNGNSWTTSYPATVAINFASTVFFDVNADIYFPTWGGGVLKSTDNGDSWTDFNDGLGYKYVRAIGKSLSGPLFAGGAYGIYKTEYPVWYSVGLPICGVNHIVINSNDDIFAGVWGVNRSTDGGQSWQTINNGFVNLDIRALVVKNNGYLFAGTNDSQDGTVFRSTDNGESWVRVDDFPSGIAINGLTVGLNGEIIATATGYHNLCQKSTDDGTTWQDISHGQNIGWGKVAYNSSGDLFMASWGGGFWKLPVGDTVWVNITGSLYPYVDCIFIGSNDYIYAAKNRSTDNGATWIPLNIPANNVYSYAENSEDHLFCGTYNYGGGVFRSTDYGDTWEAINSGLPIQDVRCVTVDADDYLYAGPWGLSLYKTTTPTVTSVENEKQIPSSFSLEQNYPNPFNPSTVISYQLPVKSNVLLKVYDVLGKEIAALVNEEKPAGSYELNWYAENLPSGIYFYQLRVGYFVETKKMILMK